MKHMLAGNFMKKFIFVVSILAAGALANAKVNTNVPGEKAIQFALANKKVQAVIEKVEGSLVEVYLSEPDYEGELSQYQHIVELKYLLQEPGYCVVTAVVGLDVKRRKTPPRVTVSEPVLRSVKKVCQK